MLIRAGALTAGQGNDVVLRTLACEREKTAVGTHDMHTQSEHNHIKALSLHFTPFSVSLTLYFTICHLSVSLSNCLSPYLFLSLSLRLSCVHNTPLKAGLHVLASDWLQSKKMMSFSVGWCVSFHIHTQREREWRVEILVYSSKQKEREKWVDGNMEMDRWPADKNERRKE